MEVDFVLLREHAVGLQIPIGHCSEVGALKILIHRMGFNVSHMTIMTHQGDATLHRLHTTKMNYTKMDEYSPIFVIIRSKKKIAGWPMPKRA